MRRPLLSLAVSTLMLAFAAVSTRPALAWSPAPAAAATVTAVPDEVVSDLLSRLNAERRANGVSELQYSDEAYVVALERAMDMASNGYFAHVSPSGIGPVELLKQYGIAYGWMGENIGMCSHPLSQVAGVLHNAWSTSAGHRANMLNPNYNRVGIAVVAGGGTYYAAQIFLD